MASHEAGALHADAGSDPGKLADTSVRAPCGYVEYHCVLVRTAAARDCAPFDPEIFCVHEHIDLALTLAQRGYATWSEPRARVTYLATEPWALSQTGIYWPTHSRGWNPEHRIHFFDFESGRTETIFTAMRSTSATEILSRR